MSVCTFIGHKNTTDAIKEQLKFVIADLIKNNNVRQFYLGNQGGFDHIVHNALEELRIDYPQIEYTVVLAYMPKTRSEDRKYENSIYPDGLEFIPPRFAIIERNKWMINKSEYLICYVRNITSNANKFRDFAKKKGKIVIDL